MKRPSLASSMKVLDEDTSPDPVALVSKARQPAAKGKSPAAAATRAGMKRLLTPIEPQLHKRLKILAAQQETTLEALTRAALESYISKHHSK
jgi:hypothetical protein